MPRAFPSILCYTESERLCGGGSFSRAPHKEFGKLEARALSMLSNSLSAAQELIWMKYKPVETDGHVS